jgi:hypothetical protein
MSFLGNLWGGGGGKAPADKPAAPAPAAPKADRGVCPWSDCSCGAGCKCGAGCGCGSKRK